MNDCVFLKIGGSLITDKRSPRTFRADVAKRLGAEIREALSEKPLRLLIGHGAGSFGHAAAHRFKIHEGLAGGGGWEGYARVRLAVQELNLRLLETWAEIGLFPLITPPSSWAWRAKGGELNGAAEVARRLLDAGQIPLVCGDAVLDDSRGFSIAATEDVFIALAPLLRPRRVIVACEADGVFARDPARHPDAQLIPDINGTNAAEALRATGDNSRGNDVTGAMAGKVRRLRRLTEILPEAEIRVVGGLNPGVVKAAILGYSAAGTRISR